MNNLYEKPLSIINMHENYTNSCIWRDEEFGFTMLGVCHAGVADGRHESLDVKNKRNIDLYIRKKLLAYSEQDLKRWIRFINLCGFPMSYKGEKTVELNYGYDVDVENEECEEDNPYGDDVSYSGEVYVLRLNTGNYINNLHLFAALTAMRYIYYAFSCKYLLIPKAVFDLKRRYGKKLDNITALMLAYRMVNCGDESHAFIGYSDHTITNRKRFYNNLLTDEFSSVNRSLDVDALIIEDASYKKLIKDVDTVCKIKGLEFLE